MGLQTKIPLADVNATNLLANGDLSIWQRGTNVNSTSKYGPDRFYGNSASGDFSRQPADVNFGNFFDLGFEYAVNAEMLVGGGVIGQRIESMFLKDIPVGTKMTFSFYGASANANATGVMLTMRIADAIDDWSSDTIFPLNTGGGTGFDGGLYLGDLQDRSVVWTEENNRFSYTFELTEDMKRGLAFEVSGDLRTVTQDDKGWISNIMALTGFMLHEGAETIPYKNARPNKVEELQLCQRYYRPLIGGASSQYCTVLGYAFAGNRLLWSDSNLLMGMRDDGNGNIGVVGCTKNGVTISSGNTVIIRSQLTNTTTINTGVICNGVDLFFGTTSTSGNIYATTSVFSGGRVHAINFNDTIYANAEL